MFKKLIYLFKYIKAVNKSRHSLKNDYNISVDWVYRLYTTYTLTDDELSEIKSYGMTYARKVIVKRINEIEIDLKKLNLLEFLWLFQTIELNNKQIGISFGFKYFDTAKKFKQFIWFALYTVFAILGFMISLKIYGIIIGILLALFIYVITKTLK